LRLESYAFSVHNNKIYNFNKLSDYEEQAKMTITIERTVVDIHKSVNEMRQVKTQIDNALTILNLNEGHEDLKAQGEAI